MHRRWWTLLAVCIGVFMLLLDVTIVNVALPDIQVAFSASLSDLQWVIDAYALGLAALLLAAGSVADAVGRRRMFAIGIGVFTLASLLCGLSGGWLFLAIARGLQSVGGAIMFATSLALIAHAFPPSRRGVAVWIVNATHRPSADRLGRVFQQLHELPGPPVVLTLTSVVVFATRSRT